jgi:protein-tyrosine phosphatase
VKFVNKNNKTIGIFGGGWSRAVSVGNIQVIIDLSGGYKSVISANEKAKVLFPKFYVPFKGAIIRIEWQDFESCPLTYDYWFGLAEDIQNLKEDTNILFACYGGHGRTGTAICALLFALQLVEGDVIKFVRQVYCEKAVESKAQLGYLINMGITTEERTKLFFDHGFERTSFGNGD